MRVGVAVIGGGMAGAAAALALAQGGLEVVLVDPKPPLQPGSNELPQRRVSTLSPATKNLLERLAVWPALVGSGRVGRFEDMRVWEQGPRDELHFSASDARLAELGWVAENEAIRWALWQRLKRDGVTTVTAGLDKATINERQAKILLTDGSELRAQLLVGADGAASKVREVAGIGVSSHGYQQQGLVATVRIERGGDQTAWQRFLPGGPLALLPLFDQQHSVVWSLPELKACELRDAKEANFDRAITAALQARLGAIESIGARACFPLRRLSAQHYQAGCSVLVGDAAHVVHPLAGQGANLGFMDAAALAELVIEAHVGGKELNNRITLRGYERWRRSDNELFADSLEWIKSAYRPHRGAIADARRVTTRLIGRTPWLRSRLVEHASGFGGRVPKLARPVAA